MMRRAWTTYAPVPGLTLGLLLGIGLWPCGAQADPGAILAHLGKTPASQLDLSLAQLSEKIDAAGAQGGAGAQGFEGFAAVEDKDIVIRVYAPAAKPDQASCRKIVDRIKKAGDVDPKTGEPDNPASAFAALFSYPGVDESKIDESYAETVDSMIAVMVVIGQTGDGKGMVCQSRLLSPDVAYKKE
jgi:hypothetical protein